jgi:hypothetical protein
MSRYNGRAIFKTSNSLYWDDLKKRGLKYFRFYETPRFEEPSPFDLAEIEDIGHLWSLGDRYFKLAHQYYGDSELWWIIAWYNQKPTEAHVKIGEVINVPTPLWKVRRAYGV